jgi:hypothetical protein
MEYSEVCGYVPAPLQIIRFPNANLDDIIRDVPFKCVSSAKSLLYNPDLIDPGIKMLIPMHLSRSTFLLLLPYFP